MLEGRVTQMGCSRKVPYSQSQNLYQRSENRLSQYVDEKSLLTLMSYWLQ